MARKVTTSAVAAFMNGQYFNSGNTRVVSDCGGFKSTMYLHGNSIARRVGDAITVCNGGWSSHTTKERLNGIPGVNVHQRDFAWYLNGQAWHACGSWTLILPSGAIQNVSGECDDAIELIHESDGRTREFGALLVVS